MVKRAEALQAVEFGSWIAENEAHDLEGYFWDSPVFYSLKHDKKDIIYGTTGAGKSALYLRACALAPSIYGANAVVVPSATATQTLPFQRLQSSSGEPTEQAYLGTWLIYYTVRLVEALKLDGIDDAELIEIALRLRSAGLLNKNFFSWQELIPHTFTAVRMAASVFDPERAAIVFGDGRPGHAAQPINALDLLRRLNAHLEREGRIAVFLFDRLDAAFPPRSEQEAAALRGLFRAYQDVRAVCSQIRIKIFMRTDIWDAVTQNAIVREGQHVNVRSEHISWDRDSLLSVVVSRLARSDTVCAYAGFDRARLLSSPETQRRFFLTLLPELASSGRPTFEWAIDALKDGFGAVSPRDLIHLFASAIELSKKGAAAGIVDLPGKALVSTGMLEDALRSVARDKLQFGLLSERPDLRTAVQQLSGKVVKWSLSDLAHAWSMDDTQTSQLAAELVACGFFSKSEAREQPYWVAEIFRPALGVGAHG